MALNDINKPEDLRKLTIKEKQELASEIRSYILENVSKTGGHVSSNLGVVELTIALHSVFKTPRDKIVWDVGHQTYTHKILTGRKNKFSTLRQLDGISGFPKTSESEYDNFNTGHSSTSISAALGIARARDLKKEKYKVIAVIGDGALTGGMALEALNDVGATNTNMIVIVNDNEMSISKNTGGLARALTKMRTRKFYTNSNRKIKNLVAKIPKIGGPIIKFVHIMKHQIKRMVLSNMMFEDIGFKYLGPVDGNDIEKLEALFRRAKDLSGPILIHCKTVKGKGYKPAELEPDRFHSIGKFDISTGLSIDKEEKDYSEVFGDKLVEIAKENKKVVAITAAMADGTGLRKFSNMYPDRFFDVEIAEQHAITMAAGMASAGCVPVVAMYSSFLQRSYDQIIHDVCMQKLHVVICIDRSGIVGGDGETHQGIFDMAFLRVIPNITIMAPKNFKELEDMLDFAINKMNSPVVIRYPKGSEQLNITDCNKIEMGKSEIVFQSEEKIENEDKLKEKNIDIEIVAIGKMVSRAVNIGKRLSEKGINSIVINARFLKPFDKSIIRKDCKKIVTIEDGTIKGGLYSEISESIIKEKLDIKMRCFGYNDKFVKQGSIQKLEELNGLSEEKIYDEIIKFMNESN